MIFHLERQQTLRGDPARVWDFFSTPRNLDALTPPDLRFRIIGVPAGRMYPGQMIEYRIGMLPGVWLKWLTEITHVREGAFFVDEQRIGPYKLWHHEHHFEALPDGRGVRMTDRITYDPGWGPLGGVMDALWIRGKLRTIFDHRAKMTDELFRG